MEELYIKIKKLDERAVIPQYAHNGDVGMDMTAIDLEYDEEHDMYIYHTGLAFESNLNVGQFLFPRSSNSKKNAYLTNSVGIADSAIYRGEIQFRYKNRDSLESKMMLVAMDDALNSSDTFDEFKKIYRMSLMNQREQKKDLALNLAPYKVGDRIGQMVFMNYPTVKLEVVEELSKTERGEGGFGSTGK